MTSDTELLQQTGTVQQTSHASQTWKPRVLIAAVLLSVLVAGAGGYWLRSRNQSTHSSQQPVKKPLPTKSVSSQCAPRPTPNSETVTKLSLWLRDQVAQDDQERVIEVFIALRDDTKPSPLPEFQRPLPVIRNNQWIISPTNQAIMNKRNAIYKERLKRWKKSQDALSRRLESLGLVNSKQDWETNGFFAKLPLCNVLTVAQQPEVNSIIEAPGGERLRLFGK